MTCGLTPPLPDIAGSHGKSIYRREPSCYDPSPGEERSTSKNA
jgi:hypothetical protein